MKPTQQCDEINLKNVDQEVVVTGWIQRRRDHGGLIFVDMRDSSGIVQVVFNPEENPEAHEQAH